MIIQEAHEYMENEIRCVQRSKYCDRDCGKCELVKEDKPLIEAYGIAILALEKQIPKRPVSTRSEIVCPTCGTLVGSSPYCRYCGQKLDHSKHPTEKGGERDV